MSIHWSTSEDKVESKNLLVYLFIYKFVPEYYIYIVSTQLHLQFLPHVTTFKFMTFSSLIIIVAYMCECIHICVYVTQIATWSY